MKEINKDSAKELYQTIADQFKPKHLMGEKDFRLPDIDIDEIFGNRDTMTDEEFTTAVNQIISDYCKELINRHQE